MWLGGDCLNPTQEAPYYEKHFLLVASPQDYYQQNEKYKYKCSSLHATITCTGSSAYSANSITHVFHHQFSIVMLHHTVSLCRDEFTVSTIAQIN